MTRATLKTSCLRMREMRFHLAQSKNRLRECRGRPHSKHTLPFLSMAVSTVDRDLIANLCHNPMALLGEEDSEDRHNLEMEIWFSLLLIKWEEWQGLQWLAPENTLPSKSHLGKIVSPLVSRQLLATRASLTQLFLSEIAAALARLTCNLTSRVHQGKVEFVCKALHPRP